MYQTNTFTKILIGIVVVVLLVGLVLGLMAYFKPADDPEQDKTTDTTDATDTTEAVGDVVGMETLDSDVKVLSSDTVYPMPAKMMFRTVSALSATASEGVTVNATIKPDTAVNKNVTWQISWENPNEAFASGKNASDYISVTPIASGSSTATITCLQPFGSTIQVSVISESNPGVFATLTVDYEKRVENITAIATNEDYYFSGTTLYFDDTANWKNSEKYLTHDWNFTYTYGTGSVDATEVVSTMCYIKASDELAEAYSTAATDYVFMLKNRNALLESGLGVELYREMIDKTQEPFEQLNGDGTTTLAWPKISVFNSSQWNNIVAAFSALEGHAFDMKVVVTTKSGNDCEIILPIYINTDSIGAQVESITVDQTNIVM